MSEYLTCIGVGKVRVSREGVYQFNRTWPCSELSSDRAYWFDFANGDLVDHDVPEHSDGSAAKAMAEDCKEWLENGTQPDWAR